MNKSDGELLAGYVRDRAETDFAELVRRHLPVIYSAALRQAGDEAHLAEDITQAVFTQLAAKAGQLQKHPSVLGWLYTTTRYVAANYRRQEIRRRQRETSTHTMNRLLDQPAPELEWTLIRPVLDAAMNRLKPAEKEVVLLRHFENLSYGEVAARSGLSENTARMRVERALEKLRKELARQGVTCSAATLGGVLAAQTIPNVPTHLADKITQTSLQKLAVAGTTAGGLTAWLSLKFGLVAVTAVILIATVSYLTNSRSGAAPSAVPRAAYRPDTNTSLATAQLTRLAQTNSATTHSQVAPQALPSGYNRLHLAIVAVDSGKPIPSVPISYRASSGDGFHSKDITTDRFGITDVDYPTDTTTLELTTRKEGIADTRLRWQPSTGELIPTNYVLKAEWPVTIGGRVVDEHGIPIVDARIGWNHQDEPNQNASVESHYFSWVETRTDTNGNWQMSRIAQEMLPKVYGSASRIEYQPSAMASCISDPNLQKQLLDRTHVFVLNHGQTVMGFVTDESGQPMANATVTTGYLLVTGGHSGKTEPDGTFKLHNCSPANMPLTASAPGFAPTTVMLNTENIKSPIRLVLKSGRTLRLWVTDNQGAPVPHVTFWNDCLNRRAADHSDEPLVQLEIKGETDATGHLIVEHAPEALLNLRVSAQGFMNGESVLIRPDDQEHQVVLQPELRIHGMVTDAVTGRGVGRFRIAQGRPEYNSDTGATNIYWSPYSRFWADFSHPGYTNILSESLINGRANPGYVLKFSAEGYQAFVTRVIAANERDVELNIILTPVRTIHTTIYQPDGRPAAFADIGLVSAGSVLRLAPGGFSHEQQQSGGALLNADKNGQFDFQADPAVTRIIVANKAGYAEVNPAELAAYPFIQEAAWGRLEATAIVGGQPVANREYGLNYPGGSWETVDYDILKSKFVTDANGRFVIDKIPPGLNQLTRLIHFEDPANHSGGWAPGAIVNFEAEPGITKQLTIGASNALLTAHLQWPTTTTPVPGNQITVGMHNPYPPIIEMLRTNPLAETAIMKTEEFKMAQSQVHHYYGKVTADGALTVEDIPPGEYEMEVVAYNSEVTNGPFPHATGQSVAPVAVGNIKITVTEDQAGQTMDLGLVELQAVKMPIPR